MTTVENCIFQIRDLAYNFNSRVDCKVTDMKWGDAYIGGFDTDTEIGITVSNIRAQNGVPKVRFEIEYHKELLKNKNKDDVETWVENLVKNQLKKMPIDSVSGLAFNSTGNLIASKIFSKPWMLSSYGLDKMEPLTPTSFMKITRIDGFAMLLWGIGGAVTSFNTTFFIAPAMALIFDHYCDKAIPASKSQHSKVTVDSVELMLHLINEGLDFDSRMKSLTRNSVEDYYKFFDEIHAVPNVPITWSYEIMDGLSLNRLMSTITKEITENKESKVTEIKDDDDELDLSGIMDGRFDGDRDIIDNDDEEPGGDNDPDLDIKELSDPVLLSDLLYEHIPYIKEAHQLLTFPIIIDCDMPIGNKNMKNSVYTGGLFNKGVLEILVDDDIITETFRITLEGKIDRAMTEKMKLSYINKVKLFNLSSPRGLQITKIVDECGIC